MSWDERLWRRPILGGTRKQEEKQFSPAFQTSGRTTSRRHPSRTTAALWLTAIGRRFTILGGCGIENGNASKMDSGSLERDESRNWHITSSRMFGVSESRGGAPPDMEEHQNLVECQVLALYQPKFLVSMSAKDTRGHHRIKKEAGHKARVLME